MIGTKRMLTLFDWVICLRVCRIWWVYNDKMKSLTITSVWEYVEYDGYKTEQTAQAILNARALNPDSSLADLYDPLTMPIELRKAYTANDKAVIGCIWFWC